MFRKHYKDANNDYVPSQSLINDTKQKMYDRLCEIEFSDVSEAAHDITDTSKAEVIRINSSLNTSQKRSASHSLKIACSVAACAAIVTTTAIAGKNLLNPHSGQPQASFTATEAPTDPTTTPAAPFKLADIVGTYFQSYDKNNYATITLSNATDQGVHFVYTSVDDGKSFKEEGMATLTKNNTLTYENTTDKYGFSIFFEDTYLCFSTHGGLINNFNKTGQYVNVDGKNKFSDNNLFAFPYYFHSDTTYKFDIDHDGTNETIKYSNGILTVDDKQVNTGVYSENLRTDGFYLVDLDTSDNQVNIMLQDDGPSNDPVVSIITYKEDGSITEDQLLGDITNDSLFCDTAGRITGLMRFSLLQTWYGECSWTFSDGHLKLMEQDLYAGVDPRLYAGHKVEPSLKKAIKLNQSMDQSSEMLTMKPQKVEFTVTDNKHWVKVIGLEDKTEGWLYLEDFNIIPATKEKATEYFTNLWLAD